MLPKPFPVLAAFLALALTGCAGSSSGPAAGTWSVKADYIEACSCHLFCPCYFNTAPEGGHHCEFDNAVKVASGHVGDVDVSGAKLWLSGDLGGDFTKGMKKAVITFDPTVTPRQQEALKFLIGKIYPVHFESMETDTAPITWEQNGMGGHAKLGDIGEVILKGVVDNAGKQTVIRNLNYWGAQRNTGFRLAKATHRYRGHGMDYHYEDYNGFLIHIESDGKLEPKKG